METLISILSQKQAVAVSTEASLSKKQAWYWWATSMAHQYHSIQKVKSFSIVTKNEILK